MLKGGLICLLDEYKESFRRCADQIDGWQNLSKNDLCRKYVENSGNEVLQNAYFSAIMYRYWHLISKYYYMSSNVASPEDCYEWLEDSVYGCLKATSWDRKDSSIYKDPNGPDKVINRCMKCARLTYYQFINRKKRKDNFGLLSLDELSELFGSTISEPQTETAVDDDVGGWAIEEYIKKAFKKKDYFVAVLLDVILTQDVFDVTTSVEQQKFSTRFNIKKLNKFMSNIDSTYIQQFSKKYNFTIDDVEQGVSYFSKLKSPTIKAKIQTTLERLQHDSFFKMLNEGK